jgi:DNA-binding LacI/PurR family transcriptional regulator
MKNHAASRGTGRRPTQNDVAEKARVSVATVSRYINHSGYISTDVRKRIGTAIAALGYRPNLVARTLKIRSSNTIGLIFPDIENPFFISLIRRAEEVAHKHGHSVILCNTENRPEKEREYLEVLRGKLVDGYLLIPTDSTTPALRDLLEGEKVVYLDRTAGPDPEAVTVMLDNKKAVTIAVSYMAHLGHERIGTIGVPLTVTTGLLRMRGYRAALRAVGRGVDESLIRCADYSAESAFRETRKLLSGKNRPTAILPLSGPTTIGALRAIRELHLKVPKDISIIGFDDFEYADLLDPPLTRIAQPAYEFGATGIELLLKLMKGETIPRKNVVLEPRLIIRGSVRDLR